MFLEPIHHVACHDDAARYNRARRSDRTDSHEQCYTSIVDAPPKYTDLLHFENHVPCLNFTFRVIDVSRARYVQTPLKKCRKKKRYPSHVPDSGKMKVCALDLPGRRFAAAHWLDHSFLMRSPKLPAVGTPRAREVSRLRSCLPNTDFHAVLCVAFNVCHQSTVYQRGVATCADEARG